MFAQARVSFQWSANSYTYFHRTTAWQAWRQKRTLVLSGSGLCASEFGRRTMDKRGTPSGASGSDLRHGALAADLPRLSRQLPGPSNPGAGAIISVLKLGRIANQPASYHLFEAGNWKWKTGGAQNQHPFGSGAKIGGLWATSTKRGYFVNEPVSSGWSSSDDCWFGALPAAVTYQVFFLWRTASITILR
ncbi:hypothetical protein ABIE49_000040 [Bradyrhizobium sp. OAE829]